MIGPNMQPDGREFGVGRVSDNHECEEMKEQEERVSEGDIRRVDDGRTTVES